MRILIALICGLLCGPANAQDSGFGLLEPQQPTCRCCQAAPESACCRDTCNILSLPENMSRTLEGALGIPVASRTDRKSAPPDPPGRCMFRSALKLENYSEAADAKAFFELPGVKACDRFVPTLLQQRRDILLAYSAGTVTQAHVATSKGYADICLSSAASIYKPLLSPAEVQKIADRTMLLISAAGLPYCHGFRVNGHVITADHCVHGVAIGGAVTVRAISSAKHLGAALVWRGGEDRSRNPEKDHAVLKLDEPYAGDGAADMSWLAEPVANARLLLVQANAYKQIAAGIQSDADFGPLVSVEDNPACRVFGVSPQGFLLNGCQTDSGTSGGAYIQKDATGNLRLVGVHGGQTGRLKTAELTDCGISLPNYGVKLPLAELRSLMPGSN